MIKLLIDETEAIIEDGEWTTDNLLLTKLLNHWTDIETKTAVILDSPFSSLYSPANPWPDMTIAQAAVNTWGGQIIDEGEPPEYEQDRLY